MSFRIKAIAALTFAVFASVMPLSSVTKANTVVFDVSGTLTPPPATPPQLPTPPIPFSGTMTIDTTTFGIGITAADIAVQGFSPDFTGITSQTGVVGINPLYSVTLTDHFLESLSLTFDAVAFGFLQPFDCIAAIPVPICMFGFEGALVGFSGGKIESGLFTPDPSDAVSGTISPTPLPAALPLFATGLGGLGLLGWRRKRKGVALGTT